MTVRESIQYYKDNICKSQSARSSYLSIENKFPVLMNTELEDLKPLHVVTALKEAQGVQESTIYAYFVLIKTAIKRTIRDHKLKIRVNLKGLIKRGKKRQEDGIKYLELDDVKKIRLIEIEKVKKQLSRDLYLIMCMSGMAISDAYKFDPANHIKIDPATELTPERQWFKYQRTKNGAPCLIPVIEDAKEIITRYEGQWPLGKSIGTIKTYWNHCQWIGKQIGKDISAHTARRTMGCIFLEFGFSLEAVSSMLGHTNTEITGKLYARVGQKKLEREMAAFQPGTMSIK